VTSLGPVVPSSYVDPFAGNVVSLLHFDGNLADDLGKTWTQNGGALTSSGQSRFGGSSLYLNQNYLATPDSADFDFGTGDFTVDFWVNFSSFPQLYPAFLAGLASGQQRALCLGSASSYFATTAFAYTKSFPFVLNTWYHIAFIRNAGNIGIAVNGTILGWVVTDSTLWDFGNSMRIGSSAASPANTAVNAYIDEYRVTK